MKKLINLIKKGHKGLMRVLKYLRINDENGVISLTNIAMIVVIFKMIITPATSWQDLTALTIAISSYQFKRAIEKK